MIGVEFQVAEIGELDVGYGWVVCEEVCENDGTDGLGETEEGVAAKAGTAVGGYEFQG